MNIISKVVILHLYKSLHLLFYINPLLCAFLWDSCFPQSLCTKPLFCTPKPCRRKSWMIRVTPQVGLSTAVCQVRKKKRPQQNDPLPGQLPLTFQTVLSAFPRNNLWSADLGLKVFQLSCSVSWGLASSTWGSGGCSIRGFQGNSGKGM